MQNQIVNIGEVIAHGIFFDPASAEGPGTMDADAIFQSTARLFQLLEQRDIAYVLVGGVAMLAHVPGRNTQDIDIIVNSDSLQRLPELEVQRRDGEFLLAHLGTLRVDLLLTDNPLFDLVQRKYAARKRFVEREVRCATVEGLLLLKLFALPSLYRQGDFARVRLYENDIASLIDAYAPALPPLFDVLAGHVSDSNLAELQKIVSEIEERITRSRRRFSNRSPDAETGDT